MRLSRGLIVATLLSPLASACAAPNGEFGPLPGELESQAELDFSNQANVFSAGAIAYEDARARFHVFLNPQGILQVDKTGATDGAIPMAASPMFESGLSSMTVLPDGRYVAVVDANGRIFDAEGDEELSTFQVEPRFESDEGTSAITAVGWDGVREEVVVAVQHFNWYGWERNVCELQRFNLDGELVGQQEIVIYDDNGILLSIAGIARLPSSDAYIVAASNRIGAVTLDGTLLGGGAAPDVSFAGGLAVDVDAGQVWVTDATTTDAHAYDLGLFAP